jgi:glycosyl transferase, family 25
LFEAFDQIRIVNLRERKDRHAEMVRQLVKVGLADDPRVEFFPAIVCDDPGPFRRKGSHGAFLSHLALLSAAAQAGQSVLILQDDCDFLTPEILQYRISGEWDIFYGGYVASNPDDLPNSDIIGAHFMGFSARAALVARDYLNAYLTPDFPLDAEASAQEGFDPAIRPPIDGAFVWLRRAHPELVTQFAMLGVQRASRTDIGDRPFFDQVPGLRQVAAVARRLRSQLTTNTGEMKRIDFGR